MDGMIICIMVDSDWSLKKFLVGRERDTYTIGIRGKKKHVIVSVYPIKLETSSGVTKCVPIE